MNDSKNMYLGIDIGGTKCAIVAGDYEFNIYRKVQFETRTAERGYREIIDEFFHHADKLLAEFPDERLHRIGISCGGPLNSRTGMVHSPPNLPGWDNVPVVQLFSERYGVPAAVQNDANACALAEWLMGAGKGTRNMVFLTFGTGMGAGLILNGQLYSGTNDLGGEVGHIRLANDGPVGFGKAGSFEGFCSGGGIAQLAGSVADAKMREGKLSPKLRAAAENGRLDARTVALAAGEGDETALEIIRISAGYLGRGLAVLIDMLNPECIVIGSIFSRNEELFRPQMEKILREEAIPAALEVCSIRPAALGDSIGDFAALCVAVYDEVFKNKT
jgi:glucokinase